MLRVDVENAPPTVTLVCSGRIVLGIEVETLRCIAAGHPEQQIVLDLASVSGIDAAGLGLLVELYLRARERRAQLSLANASAQVCRMLTLTRLERVFGSCGSDTYQSVRDRASEQWCSMTA